jgi:hypothetical protein
MVPFWDKGDYYVPDYKMVRCAACSRTSTWRNPILNHRCKCGRWLNGGKRRLMPALPSAPEITDPSCE